MDSDMSRTHEAHHKKIDKIAITPIENGFVADFPELTIPDEVDKYELKYTGYTASRNPCVYSPRKAPPSNTRHPSTSFSEALPSGILFSLEYTLSCMFLLSRVSSFQCFFFPVFLLSSVSSFQCFFFPVFLLSRNSPKFLHVSAARSSYPSRLHTPSDYHQRRSHDGME